MVLLLAVALWALEASSAADVPNIEDLRGYGGYLNEMEVRIQESVAEWSDRLQGIAYRLLLALLVVAAVVRGAQLVFQGQDLSGVVFDLVKLVAIGGFYATAIEYAAPAADVIIRSFTGAADLAAGAGGATSAGSIFVTGVDHARFILAEAGTFEWVLMATLSLLIVVGFGVIAAYALLVVAEAWIVTAGGVVLLGFGALSWTEDFARRYIIYVFSVGAKLFGLYLTAGFSLELIDSVSGISASLDRAFALVGATVIAALLVVSIPGMVQGIVNGSSIGMGTGAVMGLLTAATKVASASAKGMAKTAAGGTDAVKAAAAGMGASSVRGAVAEGGGGVRGAAKLARAAGGVGLAGVAAAFGGRLAPEGSVGAAIKGLRAGAEAARDAPKDDE